MMYNILNKYLFDFNPIDGLYITLNKNNIEINGLNYRKYTTGVAELKNSKYSLVFYSVNSNSLITVLENGLYTHSQYLITSNKVIDDISIYDLLKYVDFEIADLVFKYFKY
ncbi:MAG: hypothetical protein ABJO28_17190 [Maribacter dokdonensis]|uniref:hypothetical protein n=1 Tax=Maribacter dokdonensis TaxID=320912 RepID=UPI00326340AB